VGFVDPPRHAPARFRTIRGSGSAARAFGILLQRLRKRCSLAVTGPPRIIELLLEAFVLVAQPIAFSLDPLQFLLRSVQFSSEPFILAADSLDVFNAIIRRRHAPVMPEFARQYKTR
jgi:hypothetical protein